MFGLGFPCHALLINKLAASDNEIGECRCPSPLAAVKILIENPVARVHGGRRAEALETNMYIMKGRLGGWS